jgi:hypothetical protein
MNLYSALTRIHFGTYFLSGHCDFHAQFMPYALTVAIWRHVGMCDFYFVVADCCARMRILSKISQQQLFYLK